jgi:Flp pilus assembly protein TadD
MAVLLVPVGVRNRHFGGTLQLTTAQLGPNLYIGNHPGADGIYRPLRPGRGDARFERIDAQAFAEDRMGRRLSPAEVSSFYVEEVWRYVREQPLDWTMLMWRKLRLVANAVEIADTEDASTHGEDSAILAVAGRVWHFGILLPLAVFGCYWTWLDRRRLWLLYALVLLYTVSVVSFYVFGRYRFLLVPPLTLLAAAGLYELSRTFRSAGTRRILAGSALLVLVAVVANRPMVDDRVMQSVTRFNYGLGLEEQGSIPEARAQYERAVRLQPSLAEAHYRLGILDLKEHAIDSAIARFEAALHFDPALHDVHNSLGMALLERGELEAAETHFLAALQTWEDDSQALNNLAHAAFRRREYALAESRYRRALEVDAKNPQTHNNLGILAAIRGDLKSAIGHFQDAVALDPSYEEARANLKRALGST